MKKLMAGFFLLLPFAGKCQQSAQHFAEYIQADRLKHHLIAIAGDEMEGRDAGKRGERLAATYMMQQFKLNGLTPPDNLKNYQQVFLLKYDNKETAELSLNNQPLSYPEDFIIPVTDNRNARFQSAELVFAGYGIQDARYNDYKGLNVKGKTVLLVLDEPKNENGTYVITGSNESSAWGTFRALEKKLQVAAQHGAVGALIISPTQKSFQSSTVTNAEKSRLYIMQNTSEKPLSYAVLSHAFVRKHFGEEGAMWLTHITGNQPFTREHRKKLKQSVTFNYKKQTVLLPSANIAGVIEGSDKKDEFVFVTAHYDHLGVRDGKIYNGADDDGSGTVAIMEIGAAFARAKAAGVGPRRTVIILAFTAEEKGLLGSRYFSEHPFVNLDATSAALNIDMIGRVDTERMKDDTLNYIYIVGHDKISTDLKSVSEGVNTQHARLNFDYKFDHPEDPHRIYFRSDHYHFARKGVPVLFFYDGMLKADYHKPTDTYEKINYTLYEKRARLVFHIAWEMANREEKLVRDLEIPTSTR
ncbi:MAG: M28 family peptidase [Ferruginibacter sp.]|nr:M28 family peptidase [Ferruginibacter sp.]